MNFYIAGKIDSINKDYPCVELQTDNWDDYSFKTTFYVTFYKSQEEAVYIGQNKIISKQLNIPEGKRDDWTVYHLQSDFKILDENFVSIGQEEEFYKNLKKLDRQVIEEILEGLRDCGYNREFLDGFKHRSVQDSLFRSITTEKLLNEARIILFSDSISNPFSFNFVFSPLYNKDNQIDFNLNFNAKEKYFPNRIIALIGENGVGKTQVINQLPEYIQRKKLLFNRIIHITNSYYDRGVSIERNVHPEYRYFGIVNTVEGVPVVTTKQEQIKETEGVLRKIVNRFKKEIDYRLISHSFNDISNLFPKVRFDEIYNCFDPSDDSEIDINLSNFISDFSLLSSGESILLSNLIKMLSCITFNSILLIDEPEIHLHPNFITSYMEYIYKILNRFDSYALIATHSTFVIREIKADCVYVIRRDAADNCEISNVARQTIGTNAMALAIDIFENDLIQPYFLKQLIQMINVGHYTEDQIFNFFEFDEKHKLDLGVKMKIHKLYEALND